MVARLYSRTGEDITKSFRISCFAASAGRDRLAKLLVLREGRVQTFNSCNSGLNRKVVSPKADEGFPIHLRAYDLLGDADNDLRELPFAERRAKLEVFIAKLDDSRIDLSPTIPFRAGTR